jgi:uncharacterized protein with HEPN domain
MFIDDGDRLRHILDACLSIQAYTIGKTRVDFDADPVLCLALIRLVEIIGEAASKLSNELKQAHDEIPWIDIVGMRNRLIHGYYDIDNTVVWRTVSEDIPKLIEQISKLLD